jgi:ferredoxin
MESTTVEIALKFVAEKDKCIGAGTCVVIAPDIFDQDDDGIVHILNEEVGEDRRAAVNEAIDFCPARALMLARTHPA